MSSSGRSATSRSRLLSSIRSGASVCQDRAVSSVPRGARIRPRSPQSLSTTASMPATWVMASTIAGGVYACGAGRCSMVSGPSAQAERMLDPYFQSSDSPEVDPNPRITLDDLCEHIVAVGAAEHDAGASVEVRGPDWPGCSAVATGPDRGCHLDGEHLLEEARDRIPVQH